MALKVARIDLPSMAGLLGAVIIVAMLAGCNSEMLDREPDAQEMREAYLASDGAKLASLTLGDKVKLAEFRKIGCGKNSAGTIRCRFFSKFGFADAADQSGGALDSLFGLASGSTRQATFYKDESGRWICVEVTLSDPDEQQ